MLQKLTNFHGLSIILPSPCPDEGEVYLVMASLHSRCGHYIFVLFPLFCSFFPCLISAVADWMSTTLPHMVWP